MRRVEAQSGEIPKRSNQLLSKRRPESIARILNKIELVISHDLGNDIHVARITEGMRNHDRTSPF